MHETKASKEGRSCLQLECHLARRDATCGSALCLLFSWQATTSQILDLSSPVAVKVVSAVELWTQLLFIHRKQNFQSKVSCFLLAER